VFAVVVTAILATVPRAPERRAGTEATLPEPAPDLPLPGLTGTRAELHGRISLAWRMLTTAFRSRLDVGDRLAFSPQCRDSRSHKVPPNATIACSCGVQRPLPASRRLELPDKKPNKKSGRSRSSRHQHRALRILAPTSPLLLVDYRRKKFFTSEANVFEKTDFALIWKPALGRSTEAYRSRNAPDRPIVELLTAPSVYFGGSGRGIFGGDTNPRLSFGRYYGSR
jgi:hypothetical protein